MVTNTRDMTDYEQCKAALDDARKSNYEAECANLVEENKQLRRALTETNDAWTAETARRVQAEAELERLRTIENAALRVAGSQREGIVTDTAVLDRLDAALEGDSGISRNSAGGWLCECGRLNASYAHPCDCERGPPNRPRY